MVPMFLSWLEYRDKPLDTSRLHRAISVIAASEKEALTNDLNKDICKVRIKTVPRPFATWYVCPRQPLSSNTSSDVWSPIRAHSAISRYPLVLCCLFSPISFFSFLSFCVCLFRMTWFVYLLEALSLRSTADCVHSPRYKHVTSLTVWPGSLCRTWTRRIAPPYIYSLS